MANAAWRLSTREEQRAAGAPRTLRRDLIDAADVTQLAFAGGKDELLSAARAAKRAVEMDVHGHGRSKGMTQDPCPGAFTLGGCGCGSRRQSALPGAPL